MPDDTAIDIILLSAPNVKSINVYYTLKIHLVPSSSEMPEFAYIYHFSQKNSVQMQKTAEPCVFFAAPLRFPLFYAIIVL